LLVSRPRLRFFWGIVTLLLCLSAAALGSDMAMYSLCDVRVLYLFDDAESIDWPTLYYLNDNLGCRIDLLSVKPREVFGRRLHETANKEIFLHEYYLPESDLVWIDSLVAELFQERRPDIVLLDKARHSKLLSTVGKYITTSIPTSDRLFNILKIYEGKEATEDTSGLSGRVVLNGNELLNLYRERMEREIPTMFPWYEVQNLTASKLISYRLVKSNLPQESPGANFLSGIGQARLADILQQHLDKGPKKQTLLKHARHFISSFKAAQLAVGKTKVDLIVNGYRQLRELTGYTNFGNTLESLVDFRPYLQDLSTKAEKAALEAVGLTWQGMIFLRDSPHGPKLKFMVSLSANGPKEIELSAVRFHPYWDTSTVVLDSVSRTIMPHQSYIKEYYIDVDRSHLEAEEPESLLFTAEIAYGQVPLVFSNSLPIWEAPELQVSFEPNYYFVPPLARLEVDRIVSSMTLRVVISKPQRYSGTVHLDLKTPRGLFAGAYRQEIQLDKGTTHETVRIPFSISNLFELGIQPLFLTLTADGKVVTTDTAQVRIAACHIADTLKVGFMPDSSGMLEDILRMTDAGFQPLTNRALMTADLDAYNVIVIGSGSFRHYPFFTKVKDQFEDYLRHGGSIVIMGQPDDWPQGALPVSLVPMTELVNEAEINNATPKTRILSKPYDISESNLLSFFNKRREVTSAVVSPAEKVYVCPSGGTLLSVSRLGEGQIIYCGFPLLKMISRLNIDAIHLLANILNY
jgi:hypothetical protein